MGENTWYQLDQPATMYAEHPRPGLYRARLVKGGCDVAVAIFVPCPMDPDFGEPIDRSRRLCALVNGKWWFRPDDIWLSCLRGGPISAKEYQYLVDDRAWAAKYAPHLPEADPWRAVVPQREEAGQSKPDQETKQVNINELDPIF